MPLISGYVEILRGTGAAAPLVASVIGRMSIGMTGFALLLLVRDVTGSYAVAGGVTAAYAVAFSIAAPVRARSADRSGPVRVVATMGVLHPLALVLLTAAAVRDVPAVVLVLLALLAGGTVPPLGSVMRALWGVVVTGDGLTTAYALEAVLIEVCFLLGPLLVGVLAATAGPAAALLCSAGLTLVGAGGLAATRTLRAVQPVVDVQHSLLGPLNDRAVRGLLRGAIGLGIAFGVAEVALTAFAEESGGGPAQAGLLLAVWSVGSVAGGFVYGGLRPKTPPREQLPYLCAALAVGSALPVLAGTPVLMALALLAYGSTIAPYSACHSVLLGRVAPRGMTTEAFAWSGSMIFGGLAFGNAAAGVLVEHASVRAALSLGVVAGVFAALSTVDAVRRIPAEPPVREGTLEQ